jgi:hypothetical protein
VYCIKKHYTFQDMTGTIPLTLILTGKGVGMDQPNNSDENELQNTSQDGVVPQDTGTDSATPVNVTVQTDDESTMNDAVLDGVPSSSEPVTAPMETPSLEVAEEVVAEAMPQSTADELAAVASELESMASTGAPVDQPVSTESAPSDSDGTDPMQQIMQEASESTVSEPYTEPQASSEDSQQPESTESQEPAQSESAEATDQPSEEVSSGPDAGSMETENEYGEGPAQTEVTDQPAETQSSEESSATTEESSMSDASSQVPPAEEPMSETPVEAPAEEPQTPLVEESTAQEETVSMPLSAEPSSSMGSAEPVAPAEETAAVASEVNDVVTPSIVAAAVAAGTSGDNAITGTPESSSVEATQESPKQSGIPKQKSNKLMIVAVVSLITLLFGGGAVAAYMMQPEKTEDSNSSATVDESTEETQEDRGQTAADTPADATTDTATPGEKVEAKTLDDYKAACSTGGMVTNATAYGGASPHPIVVFEKGSDDKFAQSLVSFKDTTWSAVASKVTGGQLVACIARKAGSEVKLKDCPITDSVTKVTADVAFHSSKYTVDVYEALTGKKVTSFENSSIATTCPTNAVYNKADPKIYAVFDQVALEASLKTVVTAAL